VMNRWLLCGNSSLSCPSTLFHKFPAAIGFHLLLSGSQLSYSPYGRLQPTNAQPEAQRFG
ncbi:MULTISPECIES: hypothetical protein, partial [Cyanophyceae]|uniref:hypothetical protein n=1 Tax=Cyanophyceae TaxID=3028117 RepID=UPI001A7EF30C